MPPLRETSRKICPLASDGVPLNCMCSTQWERPVLPGSSLRLPTRYHTQKLAIGASWLSRRSTWRPFGRVACTTGACRDDVEAVGTVVVSVEEFLAMESAFS